MDTRLFGHDPRLPLLLHKGWTSLGLSLGTAQCAGRRQVGVGVVIIFSFPTSQSAWDVRKPIYINRRNCPNEEWRRENSFITRSSPLLCSILDSENLLQTDPAVGWGRRQCLAMTTKPCIFSGEINVWSWRMQDLYLNIIPDLTENHIIKIWWCDVEDLVRVATSPYKSYPEHGCWWGETKGTLFLTTWGWQSMLWGETLAPAFKISSLFHFCVSIKLIWATMTCSDAAFHQQCFSKSFTNSAGSAKLYEHTCTLLPVPVVQLPSRGNKTSF